MNALIPALLIPLLTSCATSITPLYMATPVASCPDVRVWASKEAAQAEGDIVERCMLHALPCAGFDNSAGNAINCHKQSACKCGATDVYIKDSRNPDFWQSGAATLVGFTRK